VLLLHGVPYDYSEDTGRSDYTDKSLLHRVQQELDVDLIDYSFDIYAPTFTSAWEALEVDSS
jgi:hypothetical protein